MNKKSWTGERLETHIVNETMIEHLHRYALAMNYVVNKTVLDIACGEGYGSNLMAQKATKVYGVDIDVSTIKYATTKYKNPNLSFQIGSADKIPISTNSIDVVISFETLEHHEKHDEMLKEIKRVLKPDGIMIMSSPDKKYYSDESGFKNEFHIKELYQSEFKKLVSTFFTYSAYYNQRFIVGSVLAAQEVNQKSALEFYSGDYNNLKQIELKPIYNVVIASDRAIESKSSSFFVDEHMYQHVQNQIAEIYTSSTTWKLGRLLINPVIFIKSLFKSNA